QSNLTSGLIRLIGTVSLLRFTNVYRFSSRVPLASQTAALHRRRVAHARARDRRRHRDFQRRQQRVAASARSARGVDQPHGVDAWMSGFTGRILLAVGGGLPIGCDHVTKSLAALTLAGSPGRSWLADTVRLQYAENAGGFLSLGAQWPWLVRTGLFT